MKKPKGISFEIGCADDNGSRKWFRYLGPQKLLHIRPTLNGVNAKHGGIKLDLMIGKIRRPIPKFYIFWRFLQCFNKSYVKRETEFNPWNSGNHWFILTIPVWIGFFISASYGKEEKQPGFYFGFKTYEVNRISQNRKIYRPGGNDIFRKEVAWGSEFEKGNIYLCPSASIRGDLVD